MRDAALKFKDGTIGPRKFARMTSQEIIDHLVQIKGVGVWTAHMLLIFTLMRPDILPTGDLGIRKGFQVVYGLRSLLTINGWRNWRRNGASTHRSRHGIFGKLLILINMIEVEIRGPLTKEGRKIRRILRQNGEFIESHVREMIPSLRLSWFCGRLTET